MGNGTWRHVGHTSGGLSLTKMPALLFDLDGTLLDSDAIHKAVFKELWAARGLTMEDGFYERHVHGRLNVDVFAEFLPDEADPQALSDAKEAAFRERLPRPYPSMPGARAFLQSARAKGMPCAVVTNAMRLNADAMLQAIGLAEYFETIVIGEECAKGKPDAEPYQTAMTAVKTDPADCIAFEDSPTGLQSAHAAGAFCVGVRSSLDDRALRDAGAHISIADFDDPALESVLAQIEGKTT